MIIQLQQLLYFSLLFSIYLYQCLKIYKEGIDIEKYYNPSSANDFTIPDTQGITEDLFTTNFEDNSTNIFLTNEIPTTNLNFTNSVNIPTIPTIPNTSTNQIYNKTILTTSPSYPSTIT